MLAVKIWPMVRKSEPKCPPNANTTALYALAWSQLRSLAKEKQTPIFEAIPRTSPYSFPVNTTPRRKKSSDRMTCLRKPLELENSGGNFLPIKIGWVFFAHHKNLLWRKEAEWQRQYINFEILYILTQWKQLG